MRDFVATCRGEWLNTSMCPFVGYSRPSSILIVVDFPEPFGPSRPKTSPRRTSKSTLSTARAFARPQKSLNTFVNPRTATTISVAFGLAFAAWGFNSVAIIFTPKFSRCARRQLHRGFRFGLRRTFRRFDRRRMVMLQFLALAHQPGAVENHNQRPDVVHQGRHDRIQISERRQRQSGDDEAHAKQEVLVDDQPCAA